MIFILFSLTNENKLQIQKIKSIISARRCKISENKTWGIMYNISRMLHIPYMQLKELEVDTSAFSFPVSIAGGFRASRTTLLLGYRVHIIGELYEMTTACFKINGGLRKTPTLEFLLNLQTSPPTQIIFSLCRTSLDVSSVRSKRPSGVLAFFSGSLSVGARLADRDPPEKWDETKHVSITTRHSYSC